MLAASAPGAEAFSLFGMTFFEHGKKSADQETIGKPQHYSVTFTVMPRLAAAGVPASSPKELEKKLKTASSLWLDRDKPASGAAGLIAKARGDYKSLLAALYAEGRYGAVIHILIGGREAADLLPDAELPNPAKVKLTIDPGPPFLFSRTEIVNIAPPAIAARDRVESPAKVGFLPGRLARSTTILKAERLATDAWRQEGYPKAKVTSRRIVARHADDAVDATINIDPGRRAVYGPTAVTGAKRMDPAFIAYMAGLTPGRRYDPDDVERANKRLNRLGVFASSRVEEAAAITPDGLLPMTVAVQERPLHRYGVGASYSTLDGIGLDAYWLHRNLFGHAESLRLDAKVANFENTTNPGDLTYHVGATFVKPGVYTPDTNFTASFYGDREVLDPYTRTSITALAGFDRAFDDQLSGRLYLQGGPSHFDDDVFGGRDFADLGLAGELVYDTRDSKVDATSGYYLDGVVQPYYEFDYGNPTLRMTAEARAYHALDENGRVVLAGRIKVGSLIGPSIAEAAPDKLFFAGGGDSVRGYAYRNIGVATPSGALTGGRSLVLASAEVRTRVTSTIGLVGFVDAGYVGADPVPTFSQDIRVGAGLGLRYLTGLGPIRLDVAVPLDRRSGDPSLGFYIGIGQAF